MYLLMTITIPATKILMTYTFTLREKSWNMNPLFSRCFFLALGPIKIIPAFGRLTQEAELKLKRQIALNLPC